MIVRPPNRLSAIPAALLLGLLVLPWAWPSAAAEPPAPADAPPFRFGFSAETFTDANENDAKAALKIWIQTLAATRGLDVDPEPLILDGPEEMMQALREARIDALALPVNEYRQVREEVDPGAFIGSSEAGQIRSEEYLLLVHRDSGIQSLADLRGRSLTCWKNSRSSLAEPWLDVVLLTQGWSRGAEFCRLTQDRKLSNVVLPVFFRRTDACVVTRSGFEGLSELNPQLGQRLQVLTHSAAMVPAGFCFRKDYAGPIRETMLDEMRQLVATPAGRQLQTLFQFGTLESHPVSCLDSALELLATHERLCAASAPALAPTGGAP